MSRPSDIVKQGYVRVKSKHVGMWNRRWLVLRRKSSHSDHVLLLKYHDNVGALTAVPRVFDLSHVEYFGRMQESQKRQIFVVFSDYSSLQFVADSDKDTEKWLLAIEQEIKQDTEYVKQNKKEMFEVYLLKCNQLRARGECLLQVTGDGIKLLDMDDPSNVQVTWPLTCVRRYCVEHGILIIEVGRAASTGEGSFAFDSKDSELIYDQIDAATRRLRFPKVNTVTPSRSDGEYEYARSREGGGHRGWMASRSEISSRSRSYGSDLPRDKPPRYESRGMAEAYRSAKPELVSTGVGSDTCETYRRRRQTDHVAEEQWLIRNQITKESFESSLHQLSPTPTSSLRNKKPPPPPPSDDEGSLWSIDRGQDYEQRRSVSLRKPPPPPPADDHGSLWSTDRGQNYEQHSMKSSHRRLSDASTYSRTPLYDDAALNQAIRQSCNLLGLGSLRVEQIQLPTSSTTN